MPSVTLRVKYHNRTKVLLCYVLAWGLALLLPLLALVYLYPYKLAGSAPELGASLLALNVPLPQALRSALDSTGGGQAALGAAIAARDLVWRYAVGAAVALTWVLALLSQLLWRAGYMRPKSGARAVLGAIRTYRLMLLAIVAICLAGALALYLVGVRWISGRTVWDYLVYFGGFALIPLAAWVSFRFAAPPALSGKKAFFKRL